MANDGKEVRKTMWAMARVINAQSVLVLGLGVDEPLNYQERIDRRSGISARSLPVYLLQCLKPIMANYFHFYLVLADLPLTTPSLTAGLQRTAQRR